MGGNRSFDLNRKKSKFADFIPGFIVFRLRSSGRSEKDVSQEINRRNPPNFTR